MLSKLLNIIKEALRNMLAYKSIEETIDEENIHTVSSRMSDALDFWKEIYKDQARWLNYEIGIKSAGIAKQACEVMRMIMTDEMEINIVPENYDVNTGEDVEEGTLAWFMDECVENNLMPKLADGLEYGLAMGGFVLKPYVSHNNIYFDFIKQGDFYPIRFDDDGNITDIAFVDQFVDGDKLYTRVERHTFANNTIMVQNKAYQAQFMKDDKDEKQELGKEIPLESVKKWEAIVPEQKIENVDKPLYGYYRVAKANNVDMNSPLGISFFHPAINILEKIDRQASYLDWEYEGGQLAIDVDETALKLKKTYFDNLKYEMQQGRNRIFRTIDVGTDQTYNPYNPTLRDASYREGLNQYKRDAEDAMGLARGSFGTVETQAKTATEIVILKQRSMQTARDNQDNLCKCLKDAIDAMYVYICLYAQELGAPNINEDYNVIIDFGDSVLTDKDAEMQTRLQLLSQNILSKAEVRASYTGEPLEVAAEQIQNIIETNQSNMLNDIFTPRNNDEDEDEDEENSKDSQKKEDEEKDQLDSEKEEEETDNSKDNQKKAK